MLGETFRLTLWGDVILFCSIKVALGEYNKLFFLNVAKYKKETDVSGGFLLENFAKQMRESFNKVPKVN